MTTVYDVDTKDCLRLCEKCIEHLKGQPGHSRYAVSLLNKIYRELLKLEETIKREG